MKHEVNADEAGTPSKKRRSSNQFRNFEDDDSDNATPVDEVSAYRQLRLPAGKAAAYDGSGILTWWRDHAVQFPKLALLARNVLCILATSASSERAFSAAACMLPATQLQNGEQD
jgi:hypothetical protein